MHAPTRARYRVHPITHIRWKLGAAVETNLRPAEPLRNTNQQIKQPIKQPIKQLWNHSTSNPPNQPKHNLKTQCRIRSHDVQIACIRGICMPPVAVTFFGFSGKSSSCSWSWSVAGWLVLRTPTNSYSWFRRYSDSLPLYSCRGVEVRVVEVSLSCGTLFIN